MDYILFLVEFEGRSSISVWRKMTALYKNRELETEQTSEKTLDF